MKRKKVIASFLLIIVVFSAGIYPIVFKDKSKGNSDTLKIYLLGSGESYDKRMQTIINEFEKKYPDMKIEKVIFDMNEGDGIDGYVKKMLTDSLSGEGPDILYLDYMSTRKLEKSETLLDLKPLLEKDSEFNEENYNMNVINAGLYNGKQLVMPLDYYVNQYATTNELLDSNDITLSKDYSQKDFMDSIDKYIEGLSKNKYLFGAPISIEDFITGSGEKFIDYDKKKADFSGPEFKEIIDNYKKIYNSTPKADDMPGISGTEGLQGLKNGNVLFSNDPINIRDMFFEYESLVNAVSKETPMIGILPTYRGGDKIVPIVGKSLAISTNTKNEEASYNFIKIALSEDIQKLSDIPQFIPVNKNAAQILEEDYSTNRVDKAYKFDRDTTVVNKPLSTEFTNYYDRLLNNLDEAQITNLDIEKLIKESLLPYFNDKETYESCINVMKNKIEIYLNE